MRKAAVLPVLMYHHVSPNPGLVTLTPENFRAQMRWLAGHGYTTVGCDDLARFLQGEPLPVRSVLLTFDDGYLDNYVYAHPVLAEFGLKAALFLITGRIGDGAARPCQGEGGTATLPATPSHKACKEAVQAGRADEVMLRWSEVEKMRAAGSFEFHSHTHSHNRWDLQLADRAARLAALEADLLSSRQALEQRLGGAGEHFCWPQGYFDEDYVGVANRLGFRYLYTTHKGAATPASDPNRIPRIVVKDRDERWFGSRLRIHGSALLGRLYAAIGGFGRR